MAIGCPIQVIFYFTICFLRFTLHVLQLVIQMVQAFVVVVKHIPCFLDNLFGFPKSLEGSCQNLVFGIFECLLHSLIVLRRVILLSIHFNLLTNQTLFIFIFSMFSVYSKLYPLACFCSSSCFSICGLFDCISPSPYFCFVCCYSCYASSRNLS